jgi:hypothetical protein
MILSRSLFLTAAISVLALPALAGPAAITSSWNTGVMRTPEGKFAYCVSEAQYDNGLWLIVALNPTGDVNIGVGQKGAQLPAGGQRNSILQIEGQSAIQIPARVVKPELYVLNAGKNAALLQALAAGSAVRIDQNEFSLSGSGQAMATLKECVQVSSAGPALPAPEPQQAAVEPAVPSDWAVPGQSAPTQVASDPQVTFDAPAAPPTPAVAEASAAVTDTPPSLNTAASETINPVQVAATPTIRPLPAPLNALLVKAGVRDIAAAEIVDGSKFAWMSRTMRGTVREQTVIPGSDLAPLVDAELARLKAACDVEFESWSGATSESTGAMQLMTAQSRCRGNGRSDYSTHVFALTRGGVLSIITHQLPNGTRAAADRAQSGLVQALKDMQG